jgi:hypothetical protein
MRQWLRSHVIYASAPATLALLGAILVASSGGRSLMRQRLRSRLTIVMATLLVTTLGVGVASALDAPTASALAKNPIFGHWQQTHRCASLVHALTKVHLRPLAPGVVGDYFPNETPQQLASKKHICSGAEPQRHSHFFTRDGHFGSADQFGQQVDNGRYRVINARTLRIPRGRLGDVNFHYQITRLSGRKVLALKPVITKRMRREALAHPFEFNTAGWSVAVSYPGSTWKRVRCGPWC